ncbi:glucose-induced degradation protein 8 [Nematocida homosporus]|uniref:glucose-induced degradation protein 8 n=1 Tax=Nematocida homosporus TaxID=1912981 RepID=UPI0022209E99|nr:glucose-induced degradation protein 8 [Nematocida homosporus]KAI5185791.1 glucose-induced degradation protein 8 [Nematocida homosporus]
MKEAETKRVQKGTREVSFVLDYLISKCYIETLKQMQPTDEAKVALRHQIKTWILAGETEKAQVLLDKELPKLLQENQELASQLNTQTFIELVRKDEPEKALVFGRACIQQGQNIMQTDNLFLLLAYKNPEECSVSKDFLSLERRDTLFAAIDAAVKGKLNRSNFKKSYMEEDLHYLNLVRRLGKSQSGSRSPNKVINGHLVFLWSSLS